MKNANKLIYFKEVKKLLERLDFRLYGPETTINYWTNEISDHNYEIEYLHHKNWSLDQLTLNHYISLNSLSFSDYHGSSVQKSNIRYMEENFPQYFEDISQHKLFRTTKHGSTISDGRPLMEVVYQAHESETLIISVKALLHPEIKSIILGLQDYGLICESTWSEIENQDKEEAIESYLARDFENYIIDTRKLGEINIAPLHKEERQIEGLPTDFFKDLFCHLWSGEIFEVETETGCGVYSDFESKLDDKSDKYIIEAITEFYTTKLISRKDYYNE